MRGPTGRVLEERGRCEAAWMSSLECKSGLCHGSEFLPRSQGSWSSGPRALWMQRNLGARAGHTGDAQRMSAPPPFRTCLYCAQSGFRICCEFTHLVIGHTDRTQNARRNATHRHALLCSSLCYERAVSRDVISWLSVALDAQRQREPGSAFLDYSLTF